MVHVIILLICHNGQIANSRNLNKQYARQLRAQTDETAIKQTDNISLPFHITSNISEILTFQTHFLAEHSNCFHL